MNHETYVRHKLRNTMHALALFTAMVGLLALVGWVVFGGLGLVVMAASGTAGILLAPRVSPRFVLRLYNARPLSTREAPTLYRIVSELARRFGIGPTPEIFYLPSAAVNAFSVGSRNDSALALSYGLLRSMNTREIAGILAHEMSHVRAGDTWVMGMADAMSRMTSLMSLAGLIMLFINLPLLFSGQWTISWWLIALLIFSPNIAALLQLGLSRSREFNADMEAARLTGDPEGLASALIKIGRAEKGLLARLFSPGKGVPSPSVFRTHPETGERVRRLLEVSEGDQSKHPSEEPVLSPDSMNRPPHRPPRRHWNGLWY